LLEVVALNSNAPTSHAPVAGLATGVPLQTDCTTVLIVCSPQMIEASEVLKPAGHSEVRFTPTPTLGDVLRVGEKGRVSDAA